MVNVIKSEQYWTPQRRLMAGQSPGRRQGRLAGGHVGDIADLKKAVVLCPSCLPKFNQTAAGYVTKSNLPIVRGQCDGCGHFSERGHLLVHHTMSNLD